MTIKRNRERETEKQNANINRSKKPGTNTEASPPSGSSAVTEDGCQSDMNFTRRSSSETIKLSSWLHVTKTPENYLVYHFYFI